MKNFHQFREELINELSSHTLGSYAKKAHNQADMAARMSHNSNEMNRLADKRAKGAMKAVKKLGDKANTSSAKTDATKTATSIKRGVSQAKSWRASDRNNELANKDYEKSQKGIGRLWDKASKGK